MKTIIFVLLLLFSTLNPGCGSSVEAIPAAQVDAAQHFKNIQLLNHEILLAISNVWLPEITANFADKNLEGYPKEQQLLLIAVIWSYGLTKIKKFTLKDKQKLKAYMDQRGYKQLESFEKNTKRVLEGSIRKLLRYKANKQEAAIATPAFDEQKDNS